MDRKAPQMSKLLSKKWDAQLMQLHLKKIDAVRSSNFSSSPTHYSHLYSKKKHH
jgi:hypothetical protein